MNLPTADQLHRSRSFLVEMLANGRAKNESLLPVYRRPLDLMAPMSHVENEVSSDGEGDQSDLAAFQPERCNPAGRIFVLENVIAMLTIEHARLETRESIAKSIQRLLHR